MAPVASLERRHTRWHLPAAVLLATGLLCLTSLPVHAQVTTRVSVTSAGAEVFDAASWSGDISADGRIVTFASRSAQLVASDTNGYEDVFVHDRTTAITTRISVSSSGMQAVGSNSAPAISGDGRFVVFVSEAANLVPGDTNMASDVFVHDRQTGATTRVSVGRGRQPGRGSERRSPASAVTGSSWPSLDRLQPRRGGHERREPTCSCTIADGRTSRG